MMSVIIGIFIGAMAVHAIWGLEWQWRRRQRHGRAVPTVKPIVDVTLLQETETLRRVVRRYRTALVECAREAGDQTIRWDGGGKGMPIERYAVERVQILARQVKTLAQQVEQ